MTDVPVKILNKDYWDVAYNRMSQDEAGYNVLGGDQSKACAACRWFVSPDDCTLVHGSINPGGICSHYMAKQDMVTEPIPVTIIKEDELATANVLIATDEIAATLGLSSNEKASILDISNTLVEVSVPTLLDKVKGFLGFDKDKQHNVFSYVRSDEGYRFFVIASNNFKDRHKEIITADAHKEFVTWCDTQKAYPELWIWHAKGSRIGEIDWIDTADGMLIASGLIDKESESLVDNIKDFDGVSHGFLGVTTKEGHITQYRSYEISLLPMKYAANYGTGVNLLKELEMPFSEAKRALLVEKAGDVKIVENWEQQTDALRKSFADLGIEYKEAEDTTAETSDIVALRNELAATNKAIGDLAILFAANNKSVAEQVDSAFEARIKESVTGKGFVASERDDNVLTGDNQVAQNKNNWFDETVMAGFTNAR